LVFRTLKIEYQKYDRNIKDARMTAFFAFQAFKNPHVMKIRASASFWNSSVNLAARFNKRDDATLMAENMEGDKLLGALTTLREYYEDKHVILFITCMPYRYRGPRVFVDFPKSWNASTVEANASRRG